MTTDQRTDGRGGFRLPWANRPAAPLAEAGNGDALARIDPEAWAPDEAATDAHVGGGPGPDDLEADGDAWSVAGWPGRKAAFDGEHGAPTTESARFPGMGADGATPDPLTRADDEWPAVDVARLREMTSPGEASAAGPAPAWPSSDPLGSARGANVAAPPASEEPAVDLARLFASRAATNAAASSASSTPAPAEAIPAAAPDASAHAAAEPATVPTAATAPMARTAATEPATATTAPTPAASPAAESAAAAAPEVTSQAPGPSPERHPVREARVMPPTAASPLPVAERAAHPPPASTGATRPTKFMADLTRAMQAAAQSARDESLARLSAHARQRVEEIEQLATSGSAELRRRADEDLVETREWSKAEIARIKDEAERRLVDRKARLDDELAGHAESVRRRTEAVGETVSAYESRLAAFIEQLLAEEDPTRIATLAQTLPEPPVLTDLDAAGEPDTAADNAAAEAAAAFVAASLAETEAAARARTGMSTEAAEAAEAAAMDGLDGGAGADAWFAAERGATGERGSGAERGRDVRTELVVIGLSSVAGIAGFKRALSGIKGVRSVGVSAGQAGEFVFALSHQASLDVAAALPSLTAFATQVTGKCDGGLLVGATEPAGGE